MHTFIELILKNGMTGLKLTTFIHIKIYNIKAILVLGLHFLSPVAQNI